MSVISPVQSKRPMIRAGSPGRYHAEVYYGGNICAKSGFWAWSERVRE